MTNKIPDKLEFFRAELYLNLYAAKGHPGNWHELAERLVPDYASLSVEMQRYHRLSLEIADSLIS